MIIGDVPYFIYRSSWYITGFFQECDLDFEHDGSTRWSWVSDRLVELLSEPNEPHKLPVRFVNVLKVLMDKYDAADDDHDRVLALDSLNTVLIREGFEAFYTNDDDLHVRHRATNSVSTFADPHRPFSPNEVERRKKLSSYLDTCSEDDLIEDILLPLFRQLGYHRITASGHKDKSLEYGKDMWMRFVLPTKHVLYFGVQAKKGKLDSAGKSKSKNSNANVSEIYNQALMMLGHEIFDPEASRRVLVDHAFIVAGGEITKQARNWLGGKLNASQRSQIMFMDREDILNLYIVSNLPLPQSANTGLNDISDDIPF